jgi:hypothetical protein
MEDLMSELTPEELSSNARNPKTFSIINVINDRAYPSEEVAIYLDEKSAYLASQVDEKISELDSKITKNTTAEILKSYEQERSVLSEKRKELLNSIAESKYVFTITGIAEGRREEVFEECVKVFPLEYVEEKNALTGESVKTDIENKERDRLFTNKLWLEHITKITAPDSSVQDTLTFDEIVKIRHGLPLIASGAITESIEKIRLASAIFMIEVDEDFLAKP